jgi:hypothetical protein
MKRQTRIYLIPFLIILFPFIARSQPYLDLLNIHGQQSRIWDKNRNDSLYTGVGYFSAEASVPFRLKKDLLAFSPAWTEISLEGNHTEPLSVRSISLPAAYIRQWKNDKQKTSFVFITRSNHKTSQRISSDNLQFGGAIVHSFIRKPGLVLKFGAYYNSEFFGPFVLPLAGIDWTVNEKLNIFGVLPGSMNLEFIISKHFHAGLAFRSYTNSYLTAGKSYLRVNDNHLKAVFDFYPFENILIGIEAGHSILRKYKTGIREGGNKDEYELDLKDGYLLKIALAYRLRMEGR